MLDVHVDVIYQEVSVGSWRPLILSSFLLSVSLPLLLFGEKVFRPFACVFSGVSGSVTVFYLSSLLPFDNCNVRLISSSIAGLFLALTALCILKTGLFLVSGVGSALLSHYMLMSFYRNEFSLFQMPTYYYIVLVSTFVCGSIASIFKRKALILSASALIGSVCMLFSIHILAESTGNTVISPDVNLAIVISLSLFSILFQAYIFPLYKKRVKKKRKEVKDEELHD
jgi:hypothetical protein